MCAAAHELAYDAAAELAADQVGEYLGCEGDADRVVTHYFASALPGYVGWRWAVTVTRAPRYKTVTVDEIVLLPGPDALLAPEWVPWSERLRPGDLGVGDLLPTPPDDDRLVPSYVETDDPAIEEVAWELGLGRSRVMSRLGRDEATDRWYGGDGGPDTAMAQHAPGQCSTCGFFLPLAGSLRAVFGVCGNEFAPSDGRVVSVDHGCGAHSEALVEAAPPQAPTAPPMDDAQVEVVDTDVVAAPETGPDADAEQLGHS